MNENRTTQQGVYHWLSREPVVSVTVSKPGTHFDDGILKDINKL